MVAVHRLVLEANVVFLMPADPDEALPERNSPWLASLRELVGHQEGPQAERTDRRGWRRFRLVPFNMIEHATRRAFGAGMLGGANAAYAWNEAWRSYESAAHGLPQAPRSSDGVRRALSLVQRFGAGLTFELDGLRARVDLERAPR